MPLAREPVILGVVADPEPENSTFDIGAERPMMKTDSAGPEAADPLEVKEG